MHSDRCFYLFSACNCLIVSQRIMGWVGTIQGGHFFFNNDKDGLGRDFAGDIEMATRYCSNNNVIKQFTIHDLQVTKRSINSL